ncbi:hypothetical protein ACE1CA_34595 [Aerosakkonemataceae cyanobacterium BLCC-F167]|uniref:Uncharacterized protein n=1 Tax=Floridaenema evergladense BLCC-F167 TaxID=3153639 RepID=A0ABV4WWZ0_9CYAN
MIAHFHLQGKSDRSFSTLASFGSAIVLITRREKAIAPSQL